MHYMTVMIFFQFLSATARSISLNKFVVWNVFFVFVSCWLHDVIRPRIFSFIAFIDPSKLLLSHFSLRFRINNNESHSAHTPRVNGIWRSWSWLKYQFIKHSFILIHHRSLYFFPKWKNINNNYRYFGFCFLRASSADRYNARRAEQRIEYICCIELSFEPRRRVTMKNRNWKICLNWFIWDYFEWNVAVCLPCNAIATNQDHERMGTKRREWENEIRIKLLTFDSTNEQSFRFFCVVFRSVARRW